MLNKTIVALDQLSKSEIQDLLLQLDKFTYFKIGLELFNKYGKNIIQELFPKNKQKIFLDLKLHDIPKTVFQAIKSLEELAPEFLTIHLSGGQKMVMAALEAQEKYLPQTKILGVSYLTSLSNQDFIDLFGLTSAKEITNQFERIFTLALKTKIHGIICSPHELNIVQALEKKFNHTLIKITPGIRIDASKSEDQSRIMTPIEAFKNNADFIVMGREITQAQDLSEVINYLSQGL